MRILVASPVRQSPRVLAAFLWGLAGLDPAGAQLDYLFVDDNDEPLSTRLLREWQPPAGLVRIGKPAGAGRPTYQEHHWSVPIVRHVSALRDWCLQEAQRGLYDALLLLDADLVLQPSTLSWLVAASVPVVSELFWTRWSPGDGELPNVWVADHYRLYPLAPYECITEAAAAARIVEWLGALATPGVYRVGGLGALTLISGPALGLRYHPAGADGEDRAWCLRAHQAGLDLWVDTHAPALHLYRPAEDLPRLHELRRGAASVGSDAGADA